jgi:hypothetical protein
MDTFNADVEAMVAEAKEAFWAAQNIIDGMKDGERIQIKDLAKDVGLALAMDPKKVLGFVNHFAHNTTIAYVTRGKNGGIVKGVRPAKVVKTPKKVKTPVATVAAPVDACSF